MKFLIALFFSLFSLSVTIATADICYTVTTIDEKARLAATSASVALNEASNQEKIKPESMQEQPTQLNQLQPLYPIEESSHKRVALLFINGSTSSESLASVSLPWHEIACVIIADGGYRNYKQFIKHHNIPLNPSLFPTALVGDLDSIKEEGLKEFTLLYPNTPIHRFACAKDFTDFEAGLQMIDMKKIDRVYVIGAFGGRIDHTLANLCVLLRPHHCDKLYFIEGDELLLHSTTSVKCEESDESETILPYNTFKNDMIKLCYQGKGLTKQIEAIRNFHKRSAPPLRYEFGVEGNLLMDLALVMHTLEHPGKEVIFTSNERLVAIDPQNPLQLKLRLGRTLSLIPLKGPVKDIQTQGLVWELNHGELSAEFVGISNLVKSEKVNIAVGEGSLLCILVDEAL